jgi:nucleotide-binding universal stress UspA family protein
MAAGRPVLVVPYAGNFETVGKRILVAWDGTREANRALNDALPLLADSEAVTVMFVGANERALEQQLLALERIAGHHQADIADRVEHRFELRVAGIDGEWHIVPDGDPTSPPI